MPMQIRVYVSQDRGELDRMHHALWPSRTTAQLDSWLERWDVLTLVADPGDGKLEGFVEVADRSMVEGCVTTPVAYLEGWWVDPGARDEGLESTLLDAAERWASGRGRSELAAGVSSDGSALSLALSPAGFREVARVTICRKALWRAHS
jgi:aminoglycoside 6'-N-acetyltransferase I